MDKKYFPKIKVLLDTNIIIKLEDDHVVTDELQKITKISSANDLRLCIHPKTKEDVYRDKNEKRQSITESKLSKYHEIPFTKTPDESFLSSIGGNFSENDDVDNNLLFSVKEDIVSFLITEDADMHKKARRIGIDDSVFTINEFIIHLEQLFGEITVVNPEIKEEFVANLDKHDSLFVSIQKTYPKFGDWFQKCINEERRCWISFLGGGRIAGVCIFNSEEVDGLKKLKLCTFKTSNDSSPYLGEYLLYQALRYAAKNDYYSVFLEIYREIDDFSLDEEEKKRLLMMPSWLESFGFVDRGETQKKGEFMYEKIFSLDDDNSIGDLEFAIQRWPHFRRDSSVSAYIIPVQEKYFQDLFPGEILGKPQLFSTASNRTIKKIYISRAKRTLASGSLLFFYCSKRSHEQEGEILAMGILENTWLGNDKDSLLSFIGKRSVYSVHQIEREYLYNEEQKALAMKFRFINGLHKNLTRKILIKEGILSGSPQSIVQLKQGQKDKLISLL